MTRLVIALVVMTAAHCASASSTLRCGRALISLQASTTEVASKCGEPVSRVVLGSRDVERYGRYDSLLIEEWTYGPINGMYQYLRFEGNRLIRIDSKRGG
ncbi:DUF2845 domain-containing protein [Pseudomonas sp. R5(2019)]|nr:DUF2845 domain-containing protein [Pseudomonas sp. R5(2019)]